MSQPQKLWIVRSSVASCVRAAERASFTTEQTTRGPSAHTGTTRDIARAMRDCERYRKLDSFIEHCLQTSQVLSRVETRVLYMFWPYFNSGHNRSAGGQQSLNQTSERKELPHTHTRTARTCTNKPESLCIHSVCLSSPSAISATHNSQLQHRSIATSSSSSSS